MRRAMPMSVPSPPSSTINSQAFGRSSFDVVSHRPAAPGQLRGLVVEHRPDAAFLEPRRQLEQHAGRRLDALFGDQADAGNRSRHGRRR